jgi:hypothetical protein
LEYADEKKDKSGKDLPPKLRVSSLMAVDVVDDPAANDGMFNKHFNASVELSAKATEFMNKLLDNPDALEYVVSFLERYRVNRVDINQNNAGLNTREVQMDAKDFTIDVLKKDHPDMVSTLQNEAVKDERVRCSTIVKTANKEFVGMGMDSIVEESIDNGKTVDASLAAMRGKRLEDLKQNANKVPGADQEETLKKKDHLETAREYQKEHKCSIQEALSKTAELRQK